MNPIKMSLGLTALLCALAGCGGGDGGDKGCGGGISGGGLFGGGSSGNNDTTTCNASKAGGGQGAGSLSAAIDNLAEALCSCDGQGADACKDLTPSQQRCLSTAASQATGAAATYARCAVKTYNDVAACLKRAGCSDEGALAECFPGGDDFLESACGAAPAEAQASKAKCLGDFGDGDFGDGDFGDGDFGNGDGGGFACDDGTPIGLEAFCDDFFDCPDGSDESPDLCGS